MKRYEHMWDGRKLIIETGLLAPQASGSAVVRYGDTVVLATATMSRNIRGDVDFFPLSVEYEERLYAAGKIKGSRFIKREGRPTDEAVLTARLIDRSIRPLFDDRIRNDIQVVLTVLSYDEENDPDIVGLIAASTALTISDIPWNGPLAAVNVGCLAGNKCVLNPTSKQREEGRYFFTVAGTGERVIMLEADGQEVSEADALSAIEFGQSNLPEVIELIKKIQKEVGKEKQKIEDLQAMQIVGDLSDFDAYFVKAKKFLESHVEEYMFGELKETKKSRKDSSRDLRGLLKTHLKEEGIPDDMLRLIMNKADKMVEIHISEAIVAEDRRVDGRKINEIRPLEALVDLLPRTHGSGFFRRGETHVLSVVTLGGPGDEQTMDSMELDGKKRYMHHYNFPPFSVGETGRMTGPGRREIGHGALAEKALVPVLPDKETFPYTIRVVSEVMSSNGSSSMGSVCGSTLSLMAAGVPLKSPVAGIAMGLAQDTKGGWKVITDLQDLEDGYGGMDFKIAGTEAGITAIQMDTKSQGLTREMMEQTLAQAREARLEILAKMKETIPAPRTEMSPFAPRVVTFHINPDRIRDLIGPGGKTINQIIDETGVTIDVEQHGQVFICSPDLQSLAKAEEIVRRITRDILVGEIFEGPVTRIMEFGALVELAPGREGMVHVSEIAPQRIEKVEDALKVGQIVKVRVLRVESEGKIALSIKQVDHPLPPEANVRPEKRFPKRHGGGFGGRR